jgi:ADP-heptose:LPS heptosyltransferase
VPPDDERILIGPPGTLAQSVLSLSLIDAIRKHRPQAFLVWALEAEWASLADHHACLNETLVVPRDWQRSLRAAMCFSRQVRQSGCRTTLDVQSTVASAAVLWWSGASLRIGWTKPGMRLGSGVLHRRRVVVSGTTPPNPLVLLEPLGLASAAGRLDVPRHAAGETAIEDYVRAAHLACGFAVVHPGAGKDVWPTQCFGYLARDLGQRRRLTSVVPVDFQASPEPVERLISASGGHALAAPFRDLPYVTALLRRAAMLISCDPGWSFLASAVGTPVVCLHAPPDPATVRLFADTIRWVAPAEHGTGATDRGMRGKVQDMPMDGVLAHCLQVLDRAGLTPSRAA